MNEQQVNQLLLVIREQTAAATAQTEAQMLQTQAIHRLAESNENLIALIMQSLDEEGPDTDAPPSTYLSGKPIGG